MSLTAIAIDKKPVTYFATFLIVLAGIASFFQLGWLEDPEFTVKTAAITTIYPGASAKEVELEVTDLLELKIQEMEKLNNIHPGEILNEEFLLPMKISAYRLSKDTEIPQTRISQIIKGKRRITADTALRLSSYFGNSAKFWLGLQDDFDIEEEKENRLEILRKINEKRLKRISTTPQCV